MYSGYPSPDDPPHAYRAYREATPTEGNHSLLSPPPSSREDEDRPLRQYASMSTLRTISSSELEQWFQYSVEGRLQQASNDTYLLPADDEELDRLTLQHQLIEYRNGSLYVGPVDQVLYDSKRRGAHYPAILDVGCGPGDWSIAMANRFPFSVVLGVDLSPIQRSDEYVPGNCSFELADVNKELPWPADSFDVIHVRDINMGINHYPNLIARLCWHLRDGGIIMLAEGELQMYSAASDHVVPEPIQEYWQTLRWALRQRHIDVDVPLHLYPALTSTGVLTSAVHDEVGFPLSSYMDDEVLAHSGSVHASTMDTFLSSSKALLLSTGMTREQVALLIHQVRERLAQPGARYFTRYFFAWGRKAV